MSEPAVKRLGKELSMKDHLSDEDFHVASGPCPKSSPASFNIDSEFFPFSSFLCPFKSPLQPHADVKAHTPAEEDHRGKKHDVENEVFVHGLNSSQSAKRIAHKVNSII